MRARSRTVLNDAFCRFSNARKQALRLVRRINVPEQVVHELGFGKRRWGDFTIAYGMRGLILPIGTRSHAAQWQRTQGDFHAAGACMRGKSQAGRTGDQGLGLAEMPTAETRVLPHPQYETVAES